MKERLYIAYGSNLNKNQMNYRCPDAEVFGTAVIPDYELLFKGSGSGNYLTIEKKHGSFVPVGIWSVSEQDEKNLDRYEGCPKFYYKKEFVLEITEAATGQKTVRRAFAYIMHEERKIGMPTERYCKTCLDGYNDFGFDTGILADAVKKSLNAAEL